MPRFGVRLRILVLLLAATILPLLALNMFWTRAGRQRLISVTKSEQAVITENAANNVTNFLNEKVRALIIHSQSASVQQLDVPRSTLELDALLYQDKDLQRVALVDKQGLEKIALDYNLKLQTPKNVAQSDAFRVVNFLGGKEYISPVAIDANGHPIITIAVPLLSFTRAQDLANISTSEPGVIRSTSEIKGALITIVDLDDLWKSVLASGQDAAASSYAYVVSDKGIIIAHPDNTLASRQTSAATVPIVSQFLNNIDVASPSPAARVLEGQSEKQQAVLGTYQKIPGPNWAVIYQEPLGSIYYNVNQLTQLGLIITLGVILLMLALSLLLSRYITKPILQVAAIAEQIGGGNFAARVLVRQHDEIGVLATSVNLMGSNLQQFIGRLQAERNQLQAVLDSTTDGIVALDKQDKIVLANQTISKLAGQPSRQLIGQPIQNVFGWSQGQRPFVVDYQRSAAEQYNELTYTTPHGLQHFIDLLVVHLPSSHDQVQTIVTIHDQTKSRELDSMKLDFVSMAAHELRTPVSTVRGYLELILYKSGVNLPGPIKQYVIQARKGTLELVSLISNLLNISRIERGALTLSLDKVDWASQIHHSLSGYQLSGQEKDLQISYQGPDQGCLILADGLAIQEVLNNLVTNAIKYTEAHGRIVIRLLDQGDHYVTQVSDNGMGIPAASMEHLFSKFYRVNGGLASGSGGTGLGLFISKSIVERHDGKIGVESVEGSGSTFWFSLPKFSAERWQAHRAQAPASQTTRRHRGWITKNITR